MRRTVKCARTMSVCFQAMKERAAGVIARASPRASARAPGSPGATSQPVHLLCGANDPAELFCLDELAAYADKGLTLTTEFAVVDGADGWDGTVGHVTQMLRSELIGAGADIYLCGPPPMIEAGQDWLKDQGIDEKLVHAEKFLPS